jgi:hypothetical protein
MNAGRSRTTNETRRFPDPATRASTAAKKSPPKRGSCPNLRQSALSALTALATLLAALASGLLLLLAGLLLPAAALLSALSGLLAALVLTTLAALTTGCALALIVWVLRRRLLIAQSRGSRHFLSSLDRRPSPGSVYSEPQPSELS